MAISDFNTCLARKVKAVNKTLLDILDSYQDINSDLKEAMRYTVEAGGKRVRSAMVLWCCELISGSRANRNAKMAAAAIEMVHTYSLVHDDLPAMDDDDLRRGRPTCHIAFNEATAILAGDGLLTLAFEVLAKEIDQPTMAIDLIRELAAAAGPAGMIAGQMADLKAEKTGGGRRLLEYIHLNKTAKMFSCAAVMGATCGGANEDQIRCLREYGFNIGLGFQIADDILDVSGSSEHLGKTAGKDVKAAKLTYPSILGIEKSKELEKKFAHEAVEILEQFDSKADILRQLARVLLERTK